MTTGTYGEYATAPPRRLRRRRGGWLMFLVILLVVLLVGGIVADRVAAHYASNELRKQVVAQLAEADVQYDALDVGIGGFPFLTQVYRGNYDKISIDLKNVKLPQQAGTNEVTLPTLDVVASGVDADTQQVIQGTAKVNAEHVSGTATVAFSTLDTLVDYSAYHLTDVAFSEVNGGLHATGRAVLGGVEVPISATADITVVSGHIQIKLRDLEAVNIPAPAPLRDYLGGVAQQSLTAQLPELPFGLTLDQVSVDPDGLSITAIGQDVPLLN